MAKDRARKTALLAIGKKIRAERMGKGWNRTTLARRAGVTVATVRGCEEAAKATQPDKFKALARALGVSLQRLEADDSKDPRVKDWYDEDYGIGRWYHEAPRPSTGCGRSMKPARRRRGPCSISSFCRC